MNSILFIIIIGLVGGVSISLQSPMASIISQRLGTLESVFIIHLSGALIALIPLIYFSGGKLNEWRTLPWYTLLAGGFGLIVISAMSYMIPRIGVASALITLLAGQLIMGGILDHFGWLGAEQHPLEATRLFGFAIVFVGVWLSIK